MNHRSLALALAVWFGVVLGATSPALAQQPAGDKKKALALFDKGDAQYDLGRWKAAIDLWTQAYEAYPSPAFLFNIAQAYRQDQDHCQALHFYRRYLAKKPDAKNRGEVENFIAELEPRCQSSRPRPIEPKEGGPGPVEPKDGAGPKPVDPALGDGAPTGAEGTSADIEDRQPDDEIDDEAYDDGSEAGQARPRLFSSRVAAGPSFPSIGDLETGTLVAIAVGVGYPIYLGDLGLEPGVLLTYTPVPWEVEGGMTGTAGLTGILGNVGASYPIIPRLSVRVDAGAGVLAVSGLTAEGNPFLDEGELADGAIGLFHMRGALGAEYAITPNFVINAQPLVYSYSKSDPLRVDIESISRFEVLVGAGYKM